MANDSVIIGFGYRARSGKDTAIAEIIAKRGLRPRCFERWDGESSRTGSVGDYDVRRYAFADALKREVLSLFFNKETHYWKFLDGEQNRKGPRMGPLESFFSRVNCTGGCWLWTGKADDTGYGIVYTPEKEVKAHRFIWERVLGLEPVQLLRHRCDNRLCVNPTHLLEGTLQQNSQDMCDRVRYAHGENHPLATLSDKEIGHIEDLSDAWGMTQAELSRTFKVSTSTISRVLSGKTRKNPKPVDNSVLIEKFSEVWLSDEHKAKFRKLLQFYGTEYRRKDDDNYWVRKLADNIEKEKPQIALLSDMRFPNEFKYVKDHNGFTVRVERDGLPPSTHASETALEGETDWDYVMLNDSTLEDFKAGAVHMFDDIMESFKFGHNAH
jgi:transcriptional regulator with XRE-family HTH domain